MKTIESTVAHLDIRCPRCGNTCFPAGTTGLLIVCPAVGCNHAFRAEDMRGYLPAPERANVIAGAAPQGNGAASPLLFGRDEQGEIIVSGVEGSPSVVIVPEMVNGRAVMGIAPRAFADQTQLRRVTLPDTVAIIGEEAFAGWTELESVTFGKGLTLLDKGCFRDCTSLDSVTLPAKLQEIGRDAFARCHALAEVTLEGRVKVIRDGAFTLCQELTRFAYAARPDRISSSAFAGCFQLPQQVQDELFSGQ